MKPFTTTFAVYVMDHKKKTLALEENGCSVVARDGFMKSVLMSSSTNKLCPPAHSMLEYVLYSACLIEVSYLLAVCNTYNVLLYFIVL